MSSLPRSTADGPRADTAVPSLARQWLLAVSVGNLLVAFLARLEGLPRVEFFWVFAGLMFGAALLFGIRAAFYTYRTYTQ